MVWLARVNFDDSHGDPSVENPAAKLDSEIPEVVKQERLRISRELHDRVLQSLATVKMRAETCRQQRRPVFAFVRSALLAYRSGFPAPSLLPTN